MAKKFETNFASGTLPSWMKYDMAFNDTAPRVVSGTFFGRTGNFCEFALGAGQKRCEVFSNDFWSRGQWQTEVQEFCLDSNFPVNMTAWQAIRQYKDLGTYSGTPPFSWHLEQNKLAFASYDRQTGASFRKDIINPIRGGQWFVLATEVYLNGAAQGGFAQPGSGRALLLVNGKWVEVTQKFFGATWHTDGRQTISRWQTGIYHDTVHPVSRRWSGYIGTGTGSLKSDFGVEVGGGWIMGGGGGTPPGGGGIVVPGDPPTDPAPNPVVPIDVTVETGYAATKVGLMKASLSAGSYPHLIDPVTKKWTTSNAAGWTSGFLPAIYWRLFDLTKDTAWRDAAILSQSGIAGQATNAASAGADLGHRMKPFMRAFEMTGTASYRDTLFTAATTISAQWSANVGAIRSWQSGTNQITNFNTIADSATALEILWWAARNGHPDAATLRTRAASHMQRLKAQHLRSDGSSYHVVEWNDTVPGGVLATMANPRHTVQGQATESTWARGQAWLIYGFAVAAREAALAGMSSDAADFEDASKAAGNYFFNHLPADDVPQWDFGGPGIDIPATDPKDSSAAAIAAAGFFELARLDNSVDWNANGRALVEALAANHHAPSDIPAILTHAVSAKPQGTGINTPSIYTCSYYLDDVSAYKSAGLGTTKPLSSLATDSTWSQFTRRTPGASVVNGRMQFTLDDSTSESHVETDPEWVPDGDALLLGAITFPSWILGSGVMESIEEADWQDGNLIQVLRQTTFDASTTGSGFPAGSHITADTLQYRLIRPGSSGTSSDPQPFVAPWTALPAGTRHVKVGFLSDGISLQTSSSSGPVDSASFGERTKREAPVTFNTLKPFLIRVGSRRTNPSDTIRVQTGVVERAVGSNSPSPNPGGTVTKTSQALRLARNGKRVFPPITSAHWGDLVIFKPITTDRVQAIAGQSRGPGGPSDTFDRADNASIAVGAPVTYATLGSKSLPSVAGNRASSTTASAIRAALVDLGAGVNNQAVMFSLAAKLPNPAVKIFNAIYVPLRMTITGGVGAGYALSLGLRTDGNFDLYWVPITNSNPAGGFAGANPFLTNVVLRPATDPSGPDELAARVVGSTLQVFKRSPGGVLTQLGANFTDTTVTTGTLAGFALTGDGTNAMMIDNLHIGAVSSIEEAPPYSRAGRHLRIEVGGQPTYRDSTIVPPAGVGAGLIPSGWSAVVVPRDSGTGKVASYIWDATAGTFSMTEDAGTIGAGAVITDLGSRYVIGDREPGALTDHAANSDFAAVVPLSAKPSDAEFRALVQPGGAITGEALIALPQRIRVYAPALLAVETDPIVNLATPGTNDELIAESKLGTLVTDNGNVPFTQGGGTGTGGGIITPINSVPDGSGVELVSKGVDPTDSTKATVTLTMDVTTADPTIGYTPHATTPYQPGYSDIGPDGPFTYLAAQATPTWTANGQPLSQSGMEPSYRWWTGRYLNNSGSVGNPQSPGLEVQVVLSSGSVTAMSEVKLGRDPERRAGGFADFWVIPPSPEQSVDRFRIYATPVDADTGEVSGPRFMAYEGMGTPASDGLVLLSASGLSDARDAEYIIEIGSDRDEV